MQKSDLAQSSIFTGEEELFAFERTVSRLTEMQTEEYWNLRSSAGNSDSWWCVNLGNFIYLFKRVPQLKVCDYFIHIHAQEAVFSLPIYKVQLDIGELCNMHWLMLEYLYQVHINEIWAGIWQGQNKKLEHLIPIYTVHEYNNIIR